MKRLTAGLARYTVCECLIHEASISTFSQKATFSPFCVPSCVRHQSDALRVMAPFVADHQESEYCLQVFECAPAKRLGLLYGDLVTGDWSTIRIADICKQVQVRKPKEERVYLLPVTTRTQAELC